MSTADAPPDARPDASPPRGLAFVGVPVAPVHAEPRVASPQVSQALQQATADIVSGKSVDEAAASYQGAVEKVAGGADKVQKS